MTGRCLRIDLIRVEALFAIAAAADADIESWPSSGAERLNRSSRRLGCRVARCITMHIDAMVKSARAMSGIRIENDTYEATGCAALTAL